MVISGSENVRYFETNRVNPKNVYIKKKKEKKKKKKKKKKKENKNISSRRIQGFDEVEILMM